MIRVELHGGPEAAQKLSLVRERMGLSMEQAMTRATLKLMRHVKEQKLSGQVLNVRTGRLRRSINQRVEREGNKVVGFVGTNVSYAAIHEYGFQGFQGVRAHLRKGHPVRAHQRKVNVPERSFLRSALAEMQSEINDELAQATEQTVREVLGR